MINFIKYIINRIKYAREVKRHIKSSPYADTLYSSDWIISNHDNLMSVLPETWTHIDNIDFIVLGIKLKLLDIDWNTKQDIKEILSYLDMLGLVSTKNGFQIIRNENSKFGDAARRINNI